MNKVKVLFRNLKVMWDRLKIIFQEIKSLTINAFIIILILVLTYTILKEVNTSNVQFNPTDVPAALVEKGYTGSVVARHIVDQINFIKSTSEDSIRYIAVSNHKELPIVISNSTPEINFEIPKTGLSFTSVINFIRHYFKKDPSIVNSEVLLRQNKAIIIARFNNILVLEKVKLDSLEWGFQSISLKLLENIQPLTAANFLFLSKNFSSCDKLIKENQNKFNNTELSQSYCILGLISFRKQNYKKAELLFSQALDADSLNNYAYCLLSRIKKDRGDIKNSEILLNKSLKLPNPSSMSYYLMGELRHGQGKLNEAENLYNKAIQINPNATTPYYNLAIIKREQKNYPQAEKYFSKVLRISPFDLEGLNALGLLYTEENKFEEAEELYLTAKTINSKHYDTYINLGSLKIKQNKIKEGEVLFLKASKLNRNEHAAFQMLAYIYDVKQHNKIKAEPYYIKALNLNSSLSSVAQQLGEITYKRRKFKLATKYFEQAVRYDSSSYILYNRLAYMYELQNKFPQAKFYYYKCIEINPKNLFALSRLADIYIVEKVYSKAETLYNSIIQIDSTNASIYLNLSIVERKLKKFKESDNHLTKALNMEPKLIRHLK